MPEPLQPQSIQRTTQLLETVLQSRLEIASDLQQTAKHASGSRQKRLLALGRWFLRSVSPDDVLRRPDALSICLPLMRAAVDGPLNQSQIEDAIRSGSDRLRSDSPRRRHLIALLVYPMVILFLCMFLLAIIGIYLVPEFERMFDEFGLSLPAPTEFVFWVSHQLQNWGLIAMALFAVICLVLLVIDVVLQSRGDRSPWSRILDGLLVSSYGAWAGWASHIGMLIEAGLTQADAIAIAGAGSSQSWLQRSSAALTEQIRIGARPGDHFRHSHRHPCHLLIHALQLSDSPAQSELLHEVAAIYWDRDQHRSYWYLAWFSPAIVWIVGVCVGFLVVALFMPLVSLINGLS